MIGLLTQLQNPVLPKDLRCSKNIPKFYESITLDDIFFVIDHFLNVDNFSISLVVTTGAVKNMKSVQ